MLNNQAIKQVVSIVSNWARVPILGGGGNFPGYQRTLIENLSSECINFKIEALYWLQGADLVFRVEVLSRGKSSGRNKNYLNIRYSDGSTGGVFIDRHQWRVVSSQSQ